MVTIDDYVPARRYLAPKTASLWRWDTTTAPAVVWTDGGTIVFRDELLPVLARLSKRGLPSMNALVWLLAACRGNWPEASQNAVAGVGMLATVDRCELPDWLPQLMVQLDAVHALAGDMRTTPAIKAELAMMVFEDARPHVEVDDSNHIVRALAEHIAQGMVDSLAGSPSTIRDVLAELRLLHEGLKKFDGDAFRLRYRTGLEQAIEPVDLDIEPAEQARQLITRLQEDDELGGLARIARSLLAAIQLPRAISDHDELPIGGVSDITNHGPLDRLILSELANDGLTLAVRVAMNEALYLRREAPPSNPPRHRAVLLDSGIRLWGVPRVFATAVGMALAAGAQRNVRTDIFRATAGNIAPVVLTTRSGVVAHMEALEPEAHPGASLERFVATASAQTGLLDAVIVTSEDVAADREFQRALAAMDVPTVLVATVSREGRFRLAVHGKRGKKVLREAALDLDRLLAPPARARPPAKLIDPNVPEELPAIFSVRPFPLLLSYQPFDPAQAWPAPSKCVLSISNYRCLYHWYAANRGARLVLDNAPAGTLQWTGTAADGTTSLAVVGALQQGKLRLFRVDSTTNQCSVFTLDLHDGIPKAVCGHAGAVFVVYPNRVDAFETASGLKIHSSPLPHHTHWNRDRFFRGADQWYALSYDGFKPVFEPLLSNGKGLNAGNFLTFLDMPLDEHLVGSETPIGVTDRGGLYFPFNSEVGGFPLKQDPPMRLEAVSRWRPGVVLSDLSRKSFCQIYPDNLVPKDVSNDRATWFSEVTADLSKIVRPQAVRNRFTMIFVDREGQLGLVARRNEAVITLMENEQIVLVNRTAESPDKRALASFAPVPGPPGVGYSLHIARWKDGSRAWLDSRGMLHLKSSNPSIPELSLILRDGHLAGWTSDGRRFGMEYFSNVKNDATNRELESHVYYNVLQAFMAELT